MLTIFRLGDRDPGVRHIRTALSQQTRGPVGVPPSDGGVNPDRVENHPDLDADLFDAALDQAVRAFQQRRGLVVDGVVGDETWIALQDAGRTLGSRLLSFSGSAGFTGDDVTDLQERLLHLGFDCGRTDGVFGRRTEAALKMFQTESNLAGDGVCGPLTLRALTRLDRHIRGGNPNGMRDNERIRRQGPSLAGRTVVVDAGHGGEDTGWTRNGVCERDVVSDLADRLEGRLVAGGVTVLRTHGAGDNPSEAQRAAIANTADADVVVSLHLDCEPDRDGSVEAQAHPSRQAQGAATYFYGVDRERASVVGARLADLVQREVVARTDLLDCRTHPKTWELLRRTRMPTIRLEAGYVSHPEDCTKLADPGFRDTLAEALHAAIRRLFLPQELDPPTGQIWLPARG